MLNHRKIITTIFFAVRFVKKQLLFKADYYNRLISIARTGQAETQSSHPLHFSGSNKIFSDFFSKVSAPVGQKAVQAPQ